MEDKPTHMYSHTAKMVRNAISAHGVPVYVPVCDSHPITNFSLNLYLSKLYFISPQYILFILYLLQSAPW